MEPRGYPPPFRVGYGAPPPHTAWPEFRLTPVLPCLVQVKGVEISQNVDLLLGAHQPCFGVNAVITIFFTRGFSGSGQSANSILLPSRKSTREGSKMSQSQVAQFSKSGDEQTLSASSRSATVTTSKKTKTAKGFMAFSCRSTASSAGSHLHHRLPLSSQH